MWPSGPGGTTCGRPPPSPQLCSSRSRFGWGDEQQGREAAGSSTSWRARRMSGSDGPAILATLYFVRQGDLDDTFRIADELVNDDHDLVQKAVGGSLREAGKHDRGRLLGFLDDHAATMPRTVLRYAIEHLDKDQRSDYMTRKKLQPRP